VLVYVPALAGTRCAYPRRDGQAEFTWYTDIHSETLKEQKPATDNKFQRKIQALSSVLTRITVCKGVPNTILYADEVRLTIIAKNNQADLTTLT